jgi:hypothetical protein
MILLPNDGGQLLQEPEYFGERSFRRQALERFPELAADPDTEIGIHVTMAALGRIAVGAIRKGKLDQSRATVEFVAEVLRNPRIHPEIRNAVAISFVDPAELSTFEAGREFLESMPMAVRELLCS